MKVLIFTNHFLGQKENNATVKCHTNLNIKQWTDTCSWCLNEWYQWGMYVTLSSGSKNIVGSEKNNWNSLHSGYVHVHKWTSKCEEIPFTNMSTSSTIISYKLTSITPSMKLSSKTSNHLWIPTDYPPRFQVLNSPHNKVLIRLFLLQIYQVH